jgi:DNA repair protein RAD16
MDSGEEEEFLQKWEASVERQLQNKKQAPPGLLMPLLPFQRESLAWMCEQEDSKYKGGILADEMGMGKTIQAISLIMTNRAKQEGVVKSTLVVCPLVAMVQWRGEIERYCAAGSLSLTIYHGPKRVTDPKELLKYDVVLTTYAIVQSEFSALSKAHKVTCKYCNKKYLPPQLIIHHKFFCGPNAQRSAALAKTDKKVSSGVLSSRM